MDQFVVIRQQKVPEILGRNDLVRTLSNIVVNKGMVCMYGDPGVGKTHLAKSVLERDKYFEVTLDDIKSKEAALDFMARVRGATSHLLLDDLDPDSSGWREVATYIRENGRLSRGATIFIMKSVHKVDFCDCIQVEALSYQSCMDLAKIKFPGLSIEKIEKSFKRSQGNLRNFFDYLNFSDEKDIFLSPKDFVYDVLSKSERNPRDYIGHKVDDHGFSWGIVHENYVNAKGIDDRMHLLAEDMSIADVYDANLYEGDWNLLPYFCMHGVIKPAIEINQTLFRESIRPGSAWTKFNNYKARKSKVTEIKNRTGLDIDELLYLRTLCNTDHDKALSMMLRYKIIPQDLDVINHLAIVTKIKAKNVQLLKRRLKNEMEV